GIIFKCRSFFSKTMITTTIIYNTSPSLWRGLARLAQDYSCMLKRTDSLLGEAYALGYYMRTEKEKLVNLDSKFINMARYTCKCGTTLSNTQVPNEIEFHVFSDKLWSSIIEMNTVDTLNLPI